MRAPSANLAACVLSLSSGIARLHLLFAYAVYVRCCRYGREVFKGFISDAEMDLKSDVSNILS